MFDLTTKLSATMHTAAQAPERLGCGYWFGSLSEFNSVNVETSNNQDPIKTASFYKDSSV